MTTWYAEHRESYNAARRERYRTDPEYRDRGRQQKRSYINRNREKVNEKQKETQKKWWAKVKDTKNAQRRAKYLRNRAYREHVLQLKRESRSRQRMKVMGAE